MEATFGWEVFTPALGNQSVGKICPQVSDTGNLIPLDRVTVVGFSFARLNS